MIESEFLKEWWGWILFGIGIFFYFIIMAEIGGNKLRAVLFMILAIAPLVGVGACVYILFTEVHPDAPIYMQAMPWIANAIAIVGILFWGGLTGMFVILAYTLWNKPPAWRCDDD